MSGIYFHIPFCKQKCSYCNFHFSTNFSSKNQMINSMICELENRKNELLNQKIETIYFGGGTPSVLNYSEIKLFLDFIHKNFDVIKNPEITLEANPDDLNETYLNELFNSGINRLSIGIQSFFEEDLKLTRRIHTSEQAKNSVKIAQKIGFKNISIDLIYGIQTSNFENWKVNIQKALDLNIQHISSYALTIEEKTELFHQIKVGKLQNINENEQFKQYEFLQKELTQNGFFHYEISNFAKNGFISKHNSSYWKGKQYLGIGPSAHSFNGKNIRKWNIANNSKYIKLIKENKFAFQQEILSEIEIYNEFIMIGLRTNFGIDLNYLKQNFSHEIQNEFHKIFNKLEPFNYFIEENNHLKIKKEYWFLADGISSDFFVVNT